MRRAVVAVVGTVAGLVMLLSFKTHPMPVAAGLAASDGAGTPTPDPTAPNTRTPKARTPRATSPGKPRGSTRPAATRTATGPAIDTPYGPVQVRVTVKGASITSVTAVEHPQGDPRSDQINGFAIPQLEQEARQADGASIDAVSGATYTSEGFVRSLQSALNRAGA